MLLPILGVIALAIVALLGYAASRPNSFRVERSTRIAARPEQIVPLIDDFHAWTRWSPYEKLDPAMQRTFGGPTRGVGATYEWNGNSKAGAGRMECTSSEPSRVAMQLNFTRPMRADNLAEFTLVPDGTATKVTWGLTGNATLATKLFGIFVDMDQLVGRDFETGLANLKTVCEQGALASA